MPLICGRGGHSATTDPPPFVIPKIAQFRVSPRARKLAPNMEMVPEEIALCIHAWGMPVAVGDIFILSPQRVGPCARCPRAKPTVLHLHQRVATAAALHGGLADGRRPPPPRVPGDRAAVTAGAIGRIDICTGRLHHGMGERQHCLKFSDVSCLSRVHSVPESLNLSALSRSIAWGAMFFATVCESGQGERDIAAPPPLRSPNSLLRD